MLFVIAFLALFFLSNPTDLIEELRYCRGKYKSHITEIIHEIARIIVGLIIAIVCFVMVFVLPKKYAKVLENIETFEVIQNADSSMYVYGVDPNSNYKKEVYIFKVKEGSSERKICVRPYQMSLPNNDTELEGCLTKKITAYQTNWFVSLLTLGAGNQIRIKYILT